MGREAQQVAIVRRSYDDDSSTVYRAAGSLSEPLRVVVVCSGREIQILSTIAQTSNGQNTLHTRILVTSLPESGY